MKCFGLIDKVEALVRYCFGEHLIAVEGFVFSAFDGDCF
ncbi:hypothetical protein AT05_01585 [Schleiferia thermophila str. Yellowstone]|jgi:hypothetical protein|nr:hypothetical protein AT05_01585 [Schleiferia thermophila str. Yellowstone]